MFHTYTKTISTVALLFFVFFCIGATANAQMAQEAQFFVTPAHPGPNQEVTVRIENYAFDLNSLEITWTLDGKVIKKAVGDKQIQFTTGKLGTVSTVKVSTSKFTRSVDIRPVGLDLAWQTDTYTPPFYKGKALYSNQSLVQFIALPTFVTTNGTTLDPKTLVYTWTRNGSVLGNSSGYGRNVLSTAGGTLAKPLIVEVEVTTPDKSFTAKAGGVLGGVQPSVIFYENHPLYGIMYNLPLPQKFTLDSKEISISAAPYFFDSPQRDSATLSYAWKMNGQTLPERENPSLLVLRRPDEGAGGKATISLTLTRPEKILQFANSSVEVDFNL